MKTYSVNIDMVWSITKIVKAGSKSEAKKKAWMKFQKRIPKKDFKVYVDEV